MLFVISCTDKPDSLDLRLASRPAHLDHLRSNLPKLVQGGPLLGHDGKPAGSLLIIEAADLTEAESFAAGDPYAKAGLFARVVIQPFRAVFKDGVEIA